MLLIINVEICASKYLQGKTQTQGDNTTQKFESKALGGEEKIKTLQKSLNVMSSCHATHITASKFKNTIKSSRSLPI